MPDSTGRLTLDEIFNKPQAPKRPTLDEIFGKPSPTIAVGNNSPVQSAQESQGGLLNMIGKAIDFGLNPQKALSNEITKASPEYQSLSSEDKDYFNKQQSPTEQAIGFAKGLPSTIVGASQLGQKIFDPINKAVLGGVGLGKNYEEAKKTDVTPNLREALKPEGPGQETGFQAEQIAEFLLPFSKAGKISDAAIEAAKIPGWLKNVLKVGTRATAEGVGTGAITAAQEGEINENVKNNALLGAAFPIAGGLGKAIADPIVKYAGKVLPEEMIAKLIRPDKASYLFGKNPAKAVAEEKIIANNFDDLVTKITGRKDEIGQELVKHVDNAVQSDPTRVSNAMDIIKKNADKFAKEVTDQGMWRSFSDRVAQLTGDFEADLSTGALTKTSEKDLSKLNAKQIWELQQKVGKLTQWTGAAYDKQVNQVLHNIYRDLGKELDTLAPGAKDLQTRWANMLGAEKSAKARQAVVQRNSNIVSSGIGAGLANVVLPGDSLQERAINTIIGGLIPGFVNSARFRTRFAKLLQTELKMPPKEINELLKAFIKSEVTTSRKDL